MPLQPEDQRHDNRLHHPADTKTREAVLPEVITSFIRQYKSNKNIYPVKLTTATPVSDSVKEAIVSQIKRPAICRTSNWKLL
jgi:F0F1-type ATP synthase delta subunit